VTTKRQEKRAERARQKALRKKHRQNAEWEKTRRKNRETRYVEPVMPPMRMQRPSMIEALATATLTLALSKGLK
jgi:hypothetical protein